MSETLSTIVRIRGAYSNDTVYTGFGLAGLDNNNTTLTDDFQLTTFLENAGGFGQIDSVYRFLEYTGQEPYNVIFTIQGYKTNFGAGNIQFFKDSNSTVTTLFTQTLFDEAGSAENLSIDRSVTTLLNPGDKLYFDADPLFTNITVTAFSYTLSSPEPVFEPTYTPNALINTAQMVLSNTTVANGSTGALIVHGGVLVGKDTDILGDIRINNNPITPNSEDIIKERVFTLNANTAQFTAFPSGGVEFTNANTSAFKAQISVDVDEKYALWEVNGVLAGSTWKYTSSFSGEQTGVTFAVEDGGGNTKGVLKYKNTAGALATVGVRVVTNKV